MIKFEDLTIGQAREIAAMFGPGSTCTTREVNPFSEVLGKNVFIRMVTHHYTGKVEKLVGSLGAVLTNAAWIADDGIFTTAVAESKFSEVEIYARPVLINWGAVLDITEIDTLPSERK